MRSLYTDDISGTRSRITIFQKSSFREKYDKFAKSNEKNPEHKKYQWYVPLKSQRNSSVQNQPRYTLKFMSEHTGLSRSGHFDQFKRINETKASHQMNQNNSILSLSGRYSIGEQNVSKQIDKNPYFPHRYEDHSQNKTKWSGNREWNYQNKQQLSLPQITKSKFISYI